MTIRMPYSIERSFFRLISWNVAYRWGCLDQQLAMVLERGPDVLALQEVTAATLPRWRVGLEANGYHVVSSFDLAPDSAILMGPRKYGVLIATRQEHQPLPPDTFAIPWPERALSVVTDSPWGAIEIHATYIPCGASHDLIKIETFEGIADRLRQPSERLRILCGDFNSPHYEYSDGTVVVFGQYVRANGTILDAGDGRWAQGEHSVITGLKNYDLSDVFRARNGYTEKEWSWVRQIWGKPCGGRFDHIFASAALQAITCRYWHEWREDGLSDHAPIEADFAMDAIGK
jgi:exonuclease III